MARTSRPYRRSEAPRAIGSTSICATPPSLTARQAARLAALDPKRVGRKRQGRAYYRYVQYLGYAHVDDRYIVKVWVEGCGAETYRLTFSDACRLWEDALPEGDNDFTEDLRGERSVDNRTVNRAPLPSGKSLRPSQFDEREYYRAILDR